MVPCLAHHQSFRNGFCTPTALSHRHSPTVTLSRCHPLTVLTHCHSPTVMHCDSPTVTRSLSLTHCHRSLSLTHPLSLAHCHSPLSLSLSARHSPIGTHTGTPTVTHHYSPTVHLTVTITHPRCPLPLSLAHCHSRCHSSHCHSPTVTHYDSLTRSSLTGTPTATALTHHCHSPTVTRRCHSPHGHSPLQLTLRRDSPTVTHGTHRH